MRKLITLLMLLFTATIFAQGTITGTVMDAEMNAPLPGANVMIVGTNTGTTTDFDGNFTLEAQKSSGTVRVTFVGFERKDIKFDLSRGTQDLGDIMLTSDADALSEVVVIGSGIIDLEDDRKTPIAVSTITKSEIQKRATGNVEFPQVLKNTPNVYVTAESGGFGDSEMFVRGFDQSNTAFLLNGQPINGMEDGNMYWSNWQGITDIANAVQVQRGLGSSKLAISSVGGTVNIVTKATNKTEGGFARFMVGNGSYVKGTASYDTGVNENGWGFSFLVDYWRAHSKWANGTKGEGQNYFFSVGKEAGDHTFNFLVTGAPQWHDQNFSKDAELYDQYGLKYNNNYGFRDGEYLSYRRNYYHKPVVNLNWDWDMSEVSNLSTVMYASFGRGGGTGTYGNGLGKVDNGIDSSPEGAYTRNGLVDWDYIVNGSNIDVEDGFQSGSNGTLIRGSVNNHAWYGGVTNYEFTGLENITINAGADIRFYKGDHFRQIVDPLGLNGVREDFGGNPNNTVTATFDADPWSALFDFADEGERIDYDYSEDINYQGGFSQIEYANDIFSVFAQGAISNQSYKRYDRGNFEGERESETENKFGYNLKAGASFTFVEGNTIFGNVGKYSRQPFLDNIFPSYSDNTAFADPEVDNEEITGFEAGYAFESGSFSANFNAYYTKWENRFLNFSGNYTGNGANVENAAFLFSDISQLHKGLEIDLKWRPIMDLTIRGYATTGNWEYDGSSPVRIRNNDNSEFVDQLDVDLSGTKVGGAPQNSAGLGIDYDVISRKLSLSANWNYYDNLYGLVEVEDVAETSLAGDTYQPEQLNSYSLFDIGASYTFDLGENDIQLIGNIYNLLDHEYITQKDNYGYFFGNGTTWNIAVKYNF
ncbi:TonB-dependent receptor [Zunongwangia endophytica]|uniref:TonB-dependent receptor n=1 Tax=Zunongwangia endophytica TaxID=1808945 RepID=A0ABV8H7L0_9FLAO|nr:TonB-dependent receptor [Zunongwangia endophytica]MDN3595766.1 TonB-dependent receptor [Zunongwangia endophytica]